MTTSPFEKAPIFAEPEKQESAWPEPTTEEPDDETRSLWSFDSVCEATDGCTAELDGIFERGHPPWLIYLEYI